MSLIRILLIIALAWLVYKAFGQIKKRLSIHKSTAKRVSAVRCEYCNLYLRKEDAYREGKMYFCDRSHYLAYNRKGEA